MKIKPQNPFLAAALTLAGISFTITPGMAADATWVGNGAQAVGQAIWGGLANWNTNAAATGVGFTATFGTSFNNGYFVTVNTAQTIGTVVFTDPANANDLLFVTHAGNFSLTLNNSGPSPVINVTQSGRTLTINPILAGTAGFTKIGPGTLTLNNVNTLGLANTLSGTVVISAGTLSLGSSLALQNGLLDTAVSIAGDAANGLRTTATSLTLGGLSGNKHLADVFTTSAGGFDAVTALNLNPGAGVLASYSGNIADGGAGMTLTKTGAGIQTLTGGNSYSGATQINGGTLVFGNKAAKTAATATAVAAGGVGLGVKTADAAYYSAADVGSLFNSTLAGFTLDAASGVAIDTTNAGGSFDQTVALTAARALTKVGSGTLVLSQANTYTGTTTISGGTLTLSGSGTLGNSANNLTLNGGALDLAAFSRSVGAVSITAAAASGNTLLNGNLTGTSYAASNITGNAVVSANLLPNGTAGFAKSGAGAVTLSGVNTYTGANAVAANGGTLQFAKTTSLYNNTPASWTAANIKAASGGTLAFNVGGTNEFTTAHVTTLLTNLGGANGTSANGFAAGSNIGFDTTNASGGALTVSNIIANSSGTGGGAMGVTKLGSGTLTLSGVNTYTGATTVSAGTVVLSGARTAVATGGFNVGNLAANTGILNVTAGTCTVGAAGSNFLVGSGTGSTGILNQSGGSLTTIGNQLLVGNLGASGTYNLSAGTLTTIAGALGVTLGVNGASTGVFNLSGTGTLTMPATSTLQITRSDNSVANNVTGSFNQTAGTATVGILQIGGSSSGGGVNNAGANAALSLTGGLFSAVTFNQLSGGNNSVSTINIGGTANVTLPAFPTARGIGATATLTLDGGTLKPAAASTAYMGGLTSAKIKAGGANFDVATGRDIFISQALLTDAVSTGGGLTKAGVGALTLAGANTYTGATLVSAGRLQLDGPAAGALTTSGLTAGTGASLGFTAGTASALDLTGKPLSLGGTVALDIGATGVNDALTVGSFTLTANSAFTFNLIGAVTSGASYTLLTSATPIATGGFSISGQTIGKLTLTPTIDANTVTLTPVLAEGGWNQAGGGNWSLGDPGTTSGNWNNYKPTVAGDAALFGSAITEPATIIVDTAHSAGYLSFDNLNSVTIGTIGSSNLTLDNGAFSGLVVVNSGSHFIAENVTLAGNIIVAPATGTTLTVSGNLGGVGKGLQLTDAGTLVLSGAASTYTGSTVASAGVLKLTGDRTGTAGSFAVSSGATLEITNGSYFLGSAAFIAGNVSGTSTVTQNGGSVSFTGGDQLLVGNGAGDCVYNLSAGTLTTASVANRGVILGVNEGRTATFNLSGTGILTMGTTSALQIGRAENTAATGTTGVFNQTGADTFATVGELRIGGSSAGAANNANTTGTLNLSAGTFSAVTFTQLSGGNTSNSTINLSGTADVTLPAFPTARGTGSTATITFDGGILRPRAASASYMGGLTNAFIKAGGASFDTGLGSITIAQALLTDPLSLGGGLSKAGTNTLTLTGNSTYTGATQVTGGTLAMGGTGAVDGSSGITINDVAAKLLQASSTAMSPPVTLTLGTVTGSGTINTVDVANAASCIISNNNGVAGAALTVGALNFSGEATVNTFSINNGDSTTPAIVTTSLASNAAGIVTVNPTAATWTSGSTYDLISYGGGSIGGAGFTKFALGTVTGKLIRQNAVLGNSGTAITLAITGGDSVYWVGDTNNKWNTAAANNWKLLSSNSYTTFFDTDDVIFDDNATGAGPISVEIDLADVPTRSTLFNNTKDYVLSSSGGFGISAGSLTKNGTGKLSISSFNIYPGATAINAGTIQISGSGTLGTASAVTLGGGSLDLGTTSLAFGAVSVTAPAASGDTISNGSLTGSSYAASNTTGNAIISANLLGTGVFNKTGAGTTTLAGANTFTGAINVTEGQLNLSNWSASTVGVVTVAGTTGPILEISGSATYAIATQMFVGSTTNGTVNQTGGTVSFTAGNALLVGNGTGSSGTYNLSGGTLTSFASTARGVILGVNSNNSATFNLSGGNLSIASSILMVGRSDSAAAGTVNLFNQTGGTATVGTLAIGGTAANTTNSTLTLTAGTFTANTFPRLANATNDLTAINIGGTADVTLPNFPTARGTGATATLTFDGGTLKPKLASTAYLGGLTNAFIKAGGARFDTTGFDITVTQALLTDGVSLNGGLTKAGTNTLTLTGTNTYTGDTTVSGGTLALGASNVLANTTAVSIGSATLSTAAATTDTVGALDVTGGAIINLGAGSALAFADSSGADWAGGSLTLTGNFVSGSSLRFGTSGSGLTPTQLALITPTGFGSFALNSNGYLISGYAAWKATNAPTGTPDDDFDGDGVNNGVEYVLGGDKNTNDLSKLPSLSTTGGNLAFTFQRKQTSIDGSTGVVIQVGTNLSAWPSSFPVPNTAVSANPGVTVVKDSPAGFDTVTLTVPHAPNASKFARLNVTVTP